MNEDQQPKPGQRIKTLLRQASIVSATSSGGRRIVAYTGAYRDWTFNVGINGDWLTLGTFVCAAPTATSLRAELLETVMRINNATLLAKFALDKNDAITFEIEYRAEHIDAEILGNVLSFALSIVEEHYPKLFRIASGDARLHTLAQNIALSPAA